MGMIRGGLLTVVAILLFLSLFSANAFLTMSMSLSHDNVQPDLTMILNDIIRNQTEAAQSMDDDLQEMQVHCQQENSTEFVHSYEDRVFVFPCEVVAQGSEAVIEYAVNDIVNDSYYKEYDCEFWKCSYTPPFHLVSLKAKNYWQGWFYWALIASIVLTVLAFVLIENRNNLPFLLGGLVIIASLPFVRIVWLLSLLGYWEFLQFFALFFSKSYNVFLISFITGILLIGIGVVLKFLRIGKFVGKLFGSKGKKVDRKALKEEIKKEMKAEAKEEKKEKKK